MAMSGRLAMRFFSSKLVASDCCLESSGDCQRKKDNLFALAQSLFGMSVKRACADGQTARVGAPAEYQAAS